MAARRERPEVSIRINMLGGFNRQDVMNYIQTLTIRHREETAAYAEASEKLRKERDTLRQSLSLLRSQADDAAALQSRADSASLLSDDLTRRLEAEKARAGQLSEALAAKESALSDAQSQAESLRERLQSAEAELRTFRAINLKAAELELAARQRAEAIEQEARREADANRQIFRHLMGEARQAYDAVQKEAESTVADISGKLVEMGAWLTDMPSRFAALEDKLDALCVPEKTQDTEYSPASFDEIITPAEPAAAENNAW